MQQKYDLGYLAMQIIVLGGVLTIAASVLFGYMYISEAPRGMGWMGLVIVVAGAASGILQFGLAAIGGAILDGSTAQQNVLNEINLMRQSMAEKKEPKLTPGNKPTALTNDLPQNSDSKKWRYLKTVDSEVAAAVSRLSALDQRLEMRLAEMYLALGEKDYLQAIEKRLTEDFHNTQASLGQFENEQDLEYYKKYSLKLDSAGGKDTDEGLQVEKIERYEGRMKGFAGGIKVTYADGSIKLKKRGDYYGRKFKSEAEFEETAS